MFYIILFSWIIFDLITKYLANIYINEKINLIWNFFYIDLFKNPWIAFSIEISWIILKILTIWLIIWLFYYFFKERKEEENKKLLDISFWLILAGSIWNWIERVFFWKVIDFIWLKYFSVFNFADIFITIWVIVYIILNFKKLKEEK